MSSGAAGLGADLGTLLSSHLSPSPADVSLLTSAGAVVAAAHRGLLWARVPALRAQLLREKDASAEDNQTDVRLPNGIGQTAAGLVLSWVYRGELPRQRDEPLSVETMRELVALAQAWGIPELGLQNQRAQSAVLLGESRSQILSLSDDLLAAFEDNAGITSPFFDIQIHLHPAGSDLQESVQPEPEPEPGPGPEPESELESDQTNCVADATFAQVDPIVCRGNRAVLSCRSGFFRAMLNGGTWHETTKASEGVVQLRLPFHHDNFLVVNQFLHTGILSIETVQELRFVIELADYFDIAALHERCVDWIIESLAVETACSLWNVVESTSLGRLADTLYGATGSASGAKEREDLLGNPHQACCDFCTTYLSAIIQHESFLELEPNLLARVLSSGLVSVPTDRLTESVHRWVDARLDTEFGQFAHRLGSERNPPGTDGQERGEHTGRASAKQVAGRNSRRHELLSTLLPPATMFNRSVREMLLGVGRLGEAGPRSLV
jgi:hypothetical protein